MNFFSTITNATRFSCIFITCTPSCSRTYTRPGASLHVHTGTPSHSHFRHIRTPSHSHFVTFARLHTVTRTSSYSYTFTLSLARRHIRTPSHSHLSYSNIFTYTLYFIQFYSSLKLYSLFKRENPQKQKIKRK